MVPGILVHVPQYTGRGLPCGAVCGLGGSHRTEEAAWAERVLLVRGVLQSSNQAYMVLSGQFDGVERVQHAGALLVQSTSSPVTSIRAAG